MKARKRHISNRSLLHFNVVLPSGLSTFHSSRAVRYSRYSNSSIFHHHHSSSSNTRVTESKNEGTFLTLPKVLGTYLPTYYLALTFNSRTKRPLQLPGQAPHGRLRVPPPPNLRYAYPFCLTFSSIIPERQTTRLKYERDATTSSMHSQDLTRDC